jgi:hypothetical protein
LQLPNRSRLLWVDQLCIDQENIEEKTKQVQFMSTIYTKCTRCIAWVGEVRDDVPLEDAETAVQLLEYMSAAYYSAHPDDVPMPPAVQTNFQAAIKALGGITFDENDWWGRIWTVQEAALPDDVHLQWGPLEISWHVLDTAQRAWSGVLPREFNDLIWNGPAGGAVFNSLAAHLHWLNLARDRIDDFFRLIQHYRVRRASDPRDKIYGLLGLCDPRRLPVTAKCDYTLSPADVFCTVTQELIIDGRNLRPLTINPRQHSEQATPGIASWAMDLDHSYVAYSPNPWDLLHRYPSHRAAHNLGPIDVELIRAQVGQRVLSLTGVCLDTVARVQPGYRSNSGNTRDTERLLPQWFETAVGCAFQPDLEQRGSAASELYSMGDCRRDEAFARLVLGDVVRNDHRIPCRTVESADIEDIWKIMRGHAGGVDFSTRNTVHGMMFNQQMFVTDNDLFGCGHLDTQVGDEVWIFRGGNVPFVIRRRDEEDGYTFVGECYVQGIMMGEVFVDERFVEKTVTLY